MHPGGLVIVCFLFLFCKVEGQSDDGIDESSENAGDINRSGMKFVQALEEEIKELKTKDKEKETVIATLQTEIKNLQAINKETVAVLGKLEKDVGNLDKAHDMDAERLDSLITKVSEQEPCQSGREVGAHAYPKRVFPYTVTVKFSPAFKKVPSFVYGTTLLDTNGGYTHYNAKLKELTNSQFTIEMITWFGYTLWGARVSWMACP